MLSCGQQIKTVIHCLNQGLRKPISVTVCPNTRTTFHPIGSPYMNRKYLTELLPLYSCSKWKKTVAVKNYMSFVFFFISGNKFKTTSSECNSIKYVHEWRNHEWKNIFSWSRLLSLITVEPKIGILPFETKKFSLKLYLMNKKLFFII